MGGLTPADSPMWSHHEPRTAKGARAVDSYLQVAGKWTVTGLGQVQCIYPPPAACRISLLTIRLGQVQIGPVAVFLSGSSLTATGGATVSFQHGVYTAPHFQGVLCGGSTLSFNSSSPDPTAPGLTLVAGAAFNATGCVPASGTAGVLRFQRGQHQLLGRLLGTHSLQSLDNATVTMFLNASSSSSSSLSSPSSALTVSFQRVDVAGHSTLVLSSSSPVGSASSHFVLVTADTVVVESGGTLFANTATSLTVTTLLNVTSTGAISAAGAGYPGASGPCAGGPPSFQPSYIPSDPSASTCVFRRATRANRGLWGQSRRSRGFGPGRQCEHRRLRQHRKSGHPRQVTPQCNYIPVLLYIAVLCRSSAVLTPHVIYFPISGGGNGYYNTGLNGGSGGGVLKIVALASFKLSGVVTCEGLHGASAGSGGGAGGSLQIYAAVFTGNGTLRASGGSGNFLGGQMSGGGTSCPLITHSILIHEKYHSQYSINTPLPPYPPPLFL